MAGGSTAIESLPEYLEEWHKIAIRGYDANERHIQTALSDIMNPYLYPYTRGFYNPYSTYSGTGVYDTTSHYYPYPKLQKEMWDSFHKLWEVTKVETLPTNTIQELINSHISRLEDLMDGEAETVISEASNAYESIKEKWPELDDDSIFQNLGNIASYLLEGLRDFIESDELSDLLDTINTRLDSNRDSAVADFRNEMGMLDASLTSSFVMGVGRIEWENQQKKDETANSIYSAIISENVPSLLMAYIEDKVAQRGIKLSVTNGFLPFVSNLFVEKLKRGATEISLRQAYLQLAMATYSDFINIINTQRFSHFKWPFDVYQLGGNFLVQGVGGNTPVSKPTPAQSVFAGMAAGASIGASTGNPILMGAGAIIGGVSGYIQSQN